MPFFFLATHPRNKHKMRHRKHRPRDVEPARCLGIFPPRQEGSRDSADQTASAQAENQAHAQRETLLPDGADRGDAFVTVTAAAAVAVVDG